MPDATPAPCPRGMNAPDGDCPICDRYPWDDPPDPPEPKGADDGEG